MIDDLKLTKSRQTGVKMLAIVSVLMGAAAVGIAVARDGAIEVQAAASLSLAALAYYAIRLNGSLAARVSVTVAMIVQITLVLAAMSGHAWQLDIHMVFFAVLANANPDDLPGVSSSGGGIDRSAPLVADVPVAVDGLPVCGSDGEHWPHRVACGGCGGRDRPFC